VGVTIDPTTGEPYTKEGLAAAIANGTIYGVDPETGKPYLSRKEAILAKAKRKTAEALASKSPDLPLDLKSLPPGSSAKKVEKPPGPDIPIGVIGTIAAAAAGGGQEGGNLPKFTAYITVVMPDGTTPTIVATADTEEKAIEALRQVLKNYKRQPEDYKSTIPDVKLVADPDDCLEMIEGTISVPEKLASGQYVAYKKTKDKCFKVYSNTEQSVMEVFKDLAGGGGTKKNPYITRCLLSGH
jgi:hypothetical protein